LEAGFSSFTSYNKSVDNFKKRKQTTSFLKININFNIAKSKVLNRARSGLYNFPIKKLSKYNISFLSFVLIKSLNNIQAMLLVNKDKVMISPEKQMLFVVDYFDKNYYHSQP
jgi:hypothetical protein